MNLRHPIGAVRADNGEMGHAHLPRWHVLDETHAAESMLVSGVAASHVVEETAIDLVNNFEMARNQRFEQLDRPLLQSLGQQGVVGVSESADSEIPGLVPPELSLVEQDAHQLRNCNRRVSIV